MQPGAGGAADMPPSAAKAEVKVVSEDITYLKSPAVWEKAPSPLYRNPFFIAFNGAPLLALMFLFGYVRWQSKLTNDVAFARRLKASGAARKYLKHAKTVLRTETSHDYYCALSRALLEYIAHKINVSPEGLTSPLIAEMLTKRSVKPETLQTVRAMLEECDLVRFAPTTVTDDMMRLSYDRAAELIGKLEKELK